jgi:hypothetical protein
MHRVCGRSPCSRYPFPRLARRVRDIGVGAGVGQWTQSEANGATDLESAGGEVRVIAAQPDGRRGNGVVERRVGIMSTRTSTLAAPAASHTARRLLRGTTGGTSDWGRQRAAKGPLEGACQRSSRKDWGYVGQRAFDKALLPNRTLRRLTFAAPIGQQRQRGRAPLISPGRPGSVATTRAGTDA